MEQANKRACDSTDEGEEPDRGDVKGREGGSERGGRGREEGR